MLQIPEVQYTHQFKKGSTVTFEKKSYRVQDDGKGFLHIIVKEKSIRKKVALSDVCLFEAGTMQDYIFNGWFLFYDDFKCFATFVTAELAWLQII